MLNFKKPTIADREWIQRLYECSGYRGAEYTFANLYEEFYMPFTCEEFLTGEM